MKLKLRALRSQRYATRMLKAGDDFEAPRADARVLRALKRAEPAPEPTPEPEPEPEAEPEPQLEEEQNGPTRSEVRRMSKAELANYIRSRGEDADEYGEGRDQLLDRALALT